MSKSLGKRDLKNEVTDLREESQMFDTMLNALVDTLEEKGVLRHEDWEKKIKQRLSSR